MRSLTRSGTKTHLILRSVGGLAPEAVELTTGPPSDEPVALECLVILDVLLELAERVPSRGALGPSHERHDAVKSSRVRAPLAALGRRRCTGRRSRGQFGSSRLLVRWKGGGGAVGTGRERQSADAWPRRFVRTSPAVRSVDCGLLWGKVPRHSGPGPTRPAEAGAECSRDLSVRGHVTAGSPAAPCTDSGNQDRSPRSPRLIDK